MQARKRSDEKLLIFDLVKVILLDKKILQEENYTTTDKAILLLYLHFFLFQIFSQKI